MKQLRVKNERVFNSMLAWEKQFFPSSISQPLSERLYDYDPQDLGATLAIESIKKIASRPRRGHIKPKGVIAKLN